jgi:DNA polymerase III delta subunit
MSYLLYGQNGLLLDERLAALRAELDPQNLSTTGIDVQASSPGEIASACQAMPFFGGQRVVILRNPIQLPKRGEATDNGDEAPEDTGGRVKWAELHDILKAVPPTSQIIMRHDGSLAQTHYLVKAVKALGWKTESFSALFDQDLLQWMQHRADRAGATFEHFSAIEHLARLLYPSSWDAKGSQLRWITETPDLRLIASEIDKLSCATNDGVISIELIDEMIADRGGFKAFALNDHLFHGRPEKALQELDDVLTAGEPAERVLGQVGSEAIALATVKMSAGVPRDALAKASGISANRIGGLQQTASAIPEQALRQIADAVREADASVKDGRQANTSATIVPLVAEVAEVIRRGSGAGRRQP